MLKQKLKPYCYSENGSLKEIIVCSPAKHNVLGPEVSAVGFAKEFIAEKAYEQHCQMKMKLKDFGCIVHDLSTEVSSSLWDRLVNRIFIRDVGAAFGERMLLGASDNELRQPDFYFSQTFLKEFLDKSDIHLAPSSSSLEFGDFLIINPDCVLINTGHRSKNRLELANFLFAIGIEEVGFVSLPKTIESLHLDVVCNILGKDIFVAASFLRFSAVSIFKSSSVSYEPEYSTIDSFIGRHGFSVYWLPNKEYLLDYTNFINLNKQTVLISDETAAYYQELFPHIEFIGTEVNQLQHGAGSIRCLTMPFVREDD
ncbi:arginine deiminase family protein [Cytobacillus purgationiresistens]|uniref:Arginine deiminase n=1 Tax=Cytobacillus purgationiresistens TaxID=863449 RepID=A0ABU0AP59_9BACI|nr:arginine deiminase family protein [Cytobacillus purgationiresistens]MDQ0272978.1 arginine deiminase [Cytobacillus purgationiresistens]